MSVWSYLLEHVKPLSWTLESPKVKEIRFSWWNKRNTLIFAPMSVIHIHLPFLFFSLKRKKEIFHLLFFEEKRFRIERSRERFSEPKTCKKPKVQNIKKLSLTLKDDLRRFKLNRNRLSRHYLNNNPIFRGLKRDFLIVLF